MSKKKVSVAAGLLMIGLGLLLGYTYLKEHYGIRKTIVIKDVSNVEPGLGLRALHEQGYTGKGINVAIIDGSLLETHEEFRDRLVHFEKVGVVSENELYHGTTVASVLVGKRCGVVPEANLHFFATNFMNEENKFKALERLLSYNDTLDASEKIRFVNISSGPREHEEDFQNFIHQAWDQGMIVFTSTMPTVTNPPFALREAVYDNKEDLNNLDNIVIGDWVNEYLRQSSISREDFVRDREERDNEAGYINLYLPCGRRYVASHSAKDRYVYDYDGGLSWATPLLTGLAAMALQVNPTLTNGEILGLLSESIIRNERGLNIIDPQLLITLAHMTSE